MARLSTRILFWLLTFVALAVGSIVVSLGAFILIARFLGGTPLNVWGDMEGLIVPAWYGAGILFLVSFALVIRFVTKRSHGSSAA